MNYKIDRRIDANSGHEFFHFGRHMHDLGKPWPAGTDDWAPVKWTTTTYGVLLTGLEILDQIQEDQRLSPLGKNEKRAPVERDLIEQVAKLQAAIDDFEREIDRKEAVLYAPPEVSPANVYSSLRAVEVRQWARGLNQSGVSGLLGQLAQGNCPEELIAALLDSPIALADPLVRAVREAWQDLRRKLNPQAVVEIETMRACVERARRVIALVGGTARSAAGWERPQILAHLVASSDEFIKRGFGAFGFDEKDVARERMIQQARKG